MARRTATLVVALALGLTAGCDSADSDQSANDEMARLIEGLPDLPSAGSYRPAEFMGGACSIGSTPKYDPSRTVGAATAEEALENSLDGYAASVDRTIIKSKILSYRDAENLPKIIAFIGSESSVAFFEGGIAELPPAPGTDRPRFVRARTVVCEYASVDPGEADPDEDRSGDDNAPREGYPTPKAAADDLLRTLGPSVGLRGDERVEVRTMTYSEVRDVYETLFPPSRWREFPTDDEIYVVWIVGADPLTAPVGAPGSGSASDLQTGRSILAIVDAERRWEEFIFADFDIGDPLAEIVG